jgi:phage repressor protein C with HTH and peptisase S24 domain
MISILRRLREQAGLTQDQLAEMVSTSQGQIAKLEKGERRMTVDWAVKLAGALGAEPLELLPDVKSQARPEAGDAGPAPGRRFGADRGQAGRRSVPEAAGRFQTARSLPVRAAARGGSDQEMFLEDGPIDWVGCPDFLVNAPDAYAIYVVGDSMVPRFRPRQLLYVSPRKPPVPGDGVIVAKTNQAVMIKELVAYTGEGVVLREYGPELREFMVRTADIDAVHTVVGLREPQ